MRNPNEIIQFGRDILSSEVKALEQVASHLGDSFAKAIGAIHQCKGTVILTGVGKPYFIAQKISASMASTGTPSITLHPVDALHGDMGRISRGDVIIILSNSGSSPEIINFIKAIGELDLCRIAVTCNETSYLAKHADLTLNLGRLKEACPMGVAPSTTTTAMLAMGDALTLTLSELKGFTIESFSRNHPGGNLGRELSPVVTAMRPLPESAVVNKSDSILEALARVADKRCGAAFVVDHEGKLIGVFTSGDLTRLITNSPGNLRDPIGDHMGTTPKYVRSQTLIRSALEVIRDCHINNLAVTDESGKLLGHLDIQDLL